MDIKKIDCERTFWTVKCLITYVIVHLIKKISKKNIFKGRCYSERKRVWDDSVKKWFQHIWMCPRAFLEKINILKLPSPEVDVILNLFARQGRFITFITYMPKTCRFFKKFWKLEFRSHLGLVQRIDQKRSVVAMVTLFFILYHTGH